MAVSIASRNDKGIAILEVQGRIALGPPLRAFQSRARRVLNEPGCAGLVLNLAGLTALDSAGIGGLVTIHSSAARKQLGVVLAGVTPRIREVLAVTRVDELFRFAPDVPSALAELR